MSRILIQDWPRTNSAPDFRNSAEAELRHQNHVGDVVGFYRSRTRLSYSQLVASNFTVRGCFFLTCRGARFIEHHFAVITISNGFILNCFNMFMRLVFKGIKTKIPLCTAWRDTQLALS